MSNRWELQALIPKSKTREGVVRSVLDVFQHAGFDPMSPHVGVISVGSSDGMSDLMFDNETELVHYLDYYGGLVTLWNTQLDFDGWLVFDWDGTESEQTFPGQSVVSFSFAESYLVRNINKIKLFALARDILIQTTKCLSSPWGWLTSDGLLELCWLNGYTNLAANADLPLLGWLTASGRWPSENLREKLVSEAGAGLEPVDERVMFETRKLWPIGADDLLSINSRWLALATGWSATTDG